MPTAAPGPRARLGAARPRTPRFSSPAPCSTSTGAARRLRRQAPRQAPGSRRDRRRWVKWASSLDWRLGQDLPFLRREFAGSEDHAEGPHGGAFSPRERPPTTTPMENNKNKMWPRGAAPPPAAAAAQLAAPPPGVPVPPSLLPSFQAASLIGLLTRLPSGGRRASPAKAYLRSRLSASSFDPRPWGCSLEPGVGTAWTRLASLRLLRSPSPPGRLCCPLERGPLAMENWDFFFLTVFAWFQFLLKPTH